MDHTMMDLDDPHRRRQPLTDASSRMNHAKSPKVETPSVRVEDFEQMKSPDRMSVVMSPTPRGNKENHRLSVATDFHSDSARNSVMSAASILSSSKGKRKTHVGPWQLGKTLGKGATGRVRLAKHAVTGQTAAIKIVSKKSAAMVQSESIAAMDRNVGNFSGFSTARHMPCGIEREVVIMKLIEHPNVISLYDVWENRGELYLVLEYVEGGELFDYVSHNGPLREEEAVRIFRQIIAGLGYCHRFNICHRDLKPENILLDDRLNVKLADFGMAALQPAGHWLNTSCGSPHYAAPEIIYGRRYRGDRADMWSCGIILYALLTGFLPFDGGDLPSTLRAVKKGEYEIPQELSDEAADLIQRILQKRPEDRISMQSIWLHPLLTKYEKLHNAMADYYIGPPPPLSVKDCGEPVAGRQDVDFDILRNLQTLWHDVKPDALIDRLMCIEPTHERMFYNALVRFRDEQLENYQGQPLEYSASDYHHISRPGAKGRRGRSQNDRSTSKRRSQISAVKDLHRRLGTTQEPKSSASTESYDPYRSPKRCGSTAEVKYAQITIHRAPDEIAEKAEISSAVKPPPSIAEEAEPEPEGEDADGATDSPFSILQKRKHKPTSMKSFHSNKLPHSSSRAPGLSTRSTSYRRNVSFHHARNRSQGSTKPKRRKTAANNQSDLKRSPSAASLQMIADGVDVPPMPSSPPLPAQPTVVRPSGLKVRSLCQARKNRESDVIWREDARKVSNELGQICEEAFNGSSVTTINTTSTAAGYETPATPVSIASPEQRAKPAAKPTPGTPKDPARPYNIEQVIETRCKLLEHNKGRDDDISVHLSRIIGHLDRVIEDHKAPPEVKRTMGSGPGDPFVESPTETTLPVIDEESASPVCSPREESPKHKFKFLPTTRNSDAKTTIRMVPHSSLRSLDDVKVKPLIIRKKNQPSASDLPSSDAVQPTRAFSASSRQSRHPCGLDPIEEAPNSPRKGDKSGEGKKWSWFKHRPTLSDTPPALPPKDPKPLIPSNGTVIVNPPISLPGSPTRSDEEKEKNGKQQERVPTRKSSMERFGGTLLKKLMPKKANKGTAAPQHSSGRWSCLSLPNYKLINKKENERPNSKDDRKSDPLCKGVPDQDSSSEVDDPQNPFLNKRRSVANQNWFARVFQLKPASRVIALNTPKANGRKEIYKLLREWREYGMENVYLDKTKNIVHGQVGEVNFLRLKGVEFTAEFYTVLEHGRKANLSLVRFKQERGAASSFNKVVDTVHMVMNSRRLVVEDATRAKKMARVLDTIPSNA